MHANGGRDQKIKLKATLLEMAREWVKLAMEARATEPNGKGLVS